MFSTTTESSRRALAQFAQPKMWSLLVQMAYWSTRQVDRSKDLVGDSMLRVLDPNGLPWDGLRPFRTFMSWVLRHVYADQMRLRASGEVPLAGDKIDRTVRSDLVPVDEQIDQARRTRDGRAFIERLSKELEPDHEDLHRLLHMDLEEKTTEEEMAALGWTADEVAQGRRDYKRIGLRLKEEWIAEQAAMMRQRRQRAGVTVEADR